MFNVRGGRSLHCFGEQPHIPPILPFPSPRPPPHPPVPHRPSPLLPNPLPHPHPNPIRRHGGAFAGSAARGSQAVRALQNCIRAAGCTQITDHTLRIDWDFSITACRGTGRWTHISRAAYTTAQTGPRGSGVDTAPASCSTAGPGCPVARAECTCSRSRVAWRRGD